jgi:hypothetical protein
MNQESMEATLNPDGTYWVEPNTHVKIVFDPRDQPKLTIHATRQRHHAMPRVEVTEEQNLVCIIQSVVFTGSRQETQEEKRVIRDQYVIEVYFQEDLPHGYGYVCITWPDKTGRSIVEFVLCQ